MTWHGAATATPFCRSLPGGGNFPSPRKNILTSKKILNSQFGASALIMDRSLKLGSIGSDN